MPPNTLEVSHDLSLKDTKLTDRVTNLREAYFEAAPQICTERPTLVTRFSIEDGLLDKEKITILDKAMMYRKVLENRAPVVRHKQGYRPSYRRLAPFEIEDRSLFAGSTTSKFKGVPLYPDSPSMRVTTVFPVGSICVFNKKSASLWDCSLMRQRAS